MTSARDARLLAEIHPRLRADALAAVLRRCAERRLAPGEVLCREGEHGDALFLLLEGALRVERRGPAGRPVALGTVAAPDVIGHMAVIDGARRSATCTALAPCRLAVLPRVEALALLRGTGPAPAALRRLLLARLARQLLRTNARVVGVAAHPAR